MQPDLSVFVVKHHKKTVVYTEARLKEMELQALAPVAIKPPKEETAEQKQERERKHKADCELRAAYAAQLKQIMAAGKWVKVWLHEPTGEIEEQITSLCLEPDEKKGTSNNLAKAAAARLECMVEHWEGIDEKPSRDAYKTMAPALLSRIDEVILETLYPSGLDTDFFEPLKNPSAD